MRHVAHTHCNTLWSTATHDGVCICVHLRITRANTGKQNGLRRGAAALWYGSPSGATAVAADYLGLLERHEWCRGRLNYTDVRGSGGHRGDEGGHGSVSWTRRTHSRVVAMTHMDESCHTCELYTCVLDALAFWHS